MDINKELTEILKAKSGNKEMAIFFIPGPGIDRQWKMSIGNVNPHVMLGEIEGEIEVRDTTLEKVILKMKIALLDY